MNGRDNARAFYLTGYLGTVQRLLGDGPWVDAALGRLKARIGMPPNPPWYAQDGDHVPELVGYYREVSRPGYLNRSWRRNAMRVQLGALRSLRELRRAITRQANHSGGTHSRT